MTETKEKKQEKDQMFSSDKPVSSSSDDLLGRKGFAEKISQAINSWEGDDSSLVTAIYGKWGDGKTSTKNMIVKNIDDEKVDVIEFNPWQWGQNKNIMRSLVKELSNSLLKKDDESATEIAIKLKKYSEYSDLSSNTITSFANKLRDILIVISMALTAYHIEIVSQTVFLRLISILLLLLFLSMFTSFFNEVINFFYKKICGENENIAGLEDRKKELKKLMVNHKKTHKKTILVVIDDIDRLEPDEIKELFRMIKSNLDFPNIVYLVFFDKEIVENALTRGKDFSGQEYLEKIVQVGLNLPSIHPKSIEGIITEKIKYLMEKFGVKDEYEKERLMKLYDRGALKYFENLRAVNKFISSLHFQLSSRKINDVLEINFVDLFGLEILRQFEPKIYNELYDNKDVFLPSFSEEDPLGFEEARREKKIDKILNLSSENKEQRVESIMCVLFPGMRYPVNQGEGNNEGFVKLRVCHEERFHIYFSLFRTDKDFLQREIEEIIALIPDQKKLVNKFIELKEEGRLELWLDKMKFYIQSIPKDSAVSFLSAMFYLEDIVSDDRGMFLTTPLTKVEVMIDLHLENHQEIKEEVLLEAINKTRGVYLPISKLWIEYKGKNFIKTHNSTCLETKDRQMNKEQIKEQIKEEILKIIKKTQDKNELQSNSYLERIMAIWKELDISSYKNWRNNFFQEEQNFLNILNKLIKKDVRWKAENKKLRETLLGVSTISLLEIFDSVPEVLERFESIEETTYSTKYPDLKAAMKFARSEYNACKDKNISIITIKN